MYLRYIGLLCNILYFEPFRHGPIWLYTKSVIKYKQTLEQNLSLFFYKSSFPCLPTYYMDGQIYVSTYTYANYTTVEVFNSMCTYLIIIFRIYKNISSTYLYIYYQLGNCKLSIRKKKIFIYLYSIRLTSDASRSN